MALKLSMESHKLLMNLVKKIQERHRQNTEFRNKLEAIDTNYATQKIAIEDPLNCDNIIDGIKVPLIASEIDSIVATLTSIFISRSPIFPVLATKDNWDEALALQALIDRDARYQGWGRQMLLFINRAVRYNVAALACEQTIIRSPVIKESERPSSSDLAISYENHTFTTLKAVDMYNCIFDPRVPPADIPMRGEYAGYNELITRSELKILGTSLGNSELAYNLSKAYSSTMNDKEYNYFYPPDISDYISSKQNERDVNWLDWLGIVSDNTDREVLLKEDMYFKTILYIRIIPFELKLGASKFPEIWKLTIINLTWIISLQQVITPFNILPILFSDIREDGLGWQTKSPGENILSYEDAATELLNIRLNGSRRALSDRAIYDANYIDPNQVNSIVPAAKIPIKQDLRNLGEGLTKRMDEIYHPIPFDGQGVVNALTDLNTIMQIKDQVNGQNFTSRGERQKGNRTRYETDLIASRTDQKSLPYSIRLEQQVFNPVKLIIKTYILVSQTSIKNNDKVTDPYTEQDRTIDFGAIRSKMIDFKITDGLYNKESYSDPEVIITTLQTIGSNQQFIQEYDISKVLADFLHIFNIDVTKYRRQQPNVIPQDGSTTLPGPGNAPAPQAQGGQGTPPEAGG